MSRQRPAKCCGRCGRTCIIGWNWPEGFVCTNCVRHGVHTRGRCPGCRTERSLPGLDGTGRPVCVDCAGIPTSFRCSICGVEDEPFYSHTCLRCSLNRRLVGILDDGSGVVAPAMLPFFDAVVSMGRPRQGLTWLNSAAVRQRLTDLATGAVPLTHEGIDTFGGGPGREYLRELLMAHGALPVADKYLLAFERFEQHRLETIADPADRQIITVYLRWRHHRDLVARSEAGVLTARTQNAAQQQTNAAVRFLGWLRTRHVTLAACTQEDVDIWFATTPNAVSAAGLPPMGDPSPSLQATHDPHRTQRTSGHLIGEPSPRGPRPTPFRRRNLSSRPSCWLPCRASRPVGHQDLYVAHRRCRGERWIGRHPTRR